jgi:hypothetical protein
MMVFPGVHFFVPSQGLIEASVLHQVASAFRDNIDDGKAAVGIDTDGFILSTQHNGFTHQGMGNHITITLEAHGAVLVHFPEYTVRRVEHPGRNRLQEGQFPLVPHPHNLVGRAMHPLFLGLKPPSKITVCRLQAGEPVASPEPFPDERIWPLHLALSLSMLNVPRMSK